MTNTGIKTRNMDEFKDLFPDCCQRECLRKIVPYVKAEDYDVKYLTFSNLVAFLIAKSINESVGSTIFDYGIIFSNKDSFRLLSILDVYDNVLSDENIKNGIKFLNEDVTVNLKNSIIDRSKLVFINSELMTSSLMYTYKLVEFWFNNYWYIDSKSISRFANNGGCDEWITVLSGISIESYKRIGSDINIRNESFVKWFNVLTIDFSIGGALYNGLYNALFTEATNNPITPIQNQQVTIQMPVLNTDLNANKSKVDLVGWQDLQPGILSTDSDTNDQQPQQQMGVPFSSGATDYEHLNQQEKTIVDGLVQNMQHMEEMKNNPHAFQDEINAAKEALRQATEGIYNQQQPVAPQINIQPTTTSTDNHTCTYSYAEMEIIQQLIREKTLV